MVVHKTRHFFGGGGSFFKIFYMFLLLNDLRTVSSFFLYKNYILTLLELIKQPQKLYVDKQE